MSGSEIRHRVEERGKRLLSRLRTPGFAPELPDGAPWPELPGLANGLQTLPERERLLAPWREVAGRVATGRLSLLGQEWPKWPGAHGWHLDPATGASWPADPYCFDIPYRHAPDMGDVKYVWELNRLQFLQPVAALAALKNDADLAELCVGRLESWIDANPPFRGVNWASGIELALRVVSILVVTTLLGRQAFSDARTGKLFATLAAHGYWLMRYPSRFSSANNHLIAEASGLYLLGTLAPDLPQAWHWASYGRRVLIEEAAKQLLVDGVGAEQSPTYTAFTLEWLLLCGEVAKRIGRPFPDLFWRRLAAAAEFLRWITDAGGNQPRIGDDDEGRVFYSQSAPEDYVSSVLACCTRAVDRPDLAPPKVMPHLREGFFGPAQRGTDGPLGVRQFAAGGYTVARSRQGKRDCLWLMDHGPLGYLSIAAHGHADALAVWLHVGDRPILADAGTYLYHSGGHWRDHFRGTPAHNTLSILGQDSSRLAGAFNWSAKANCSVIAFEDDPERWFVEAEHDGFVAVFGVRHRRRVERLDRDSFRITDSLRGSGTSFDVEIGFLLHPDLTVEGADRSWAVYGPQGKLLAIEHGGVLTGRVQRGQDHRLRGWYSSGFGQKCPTTRLAFEGKLAVGTASTFTVTLP